MRGRRRLLCIAMLLAGSSLAQSALSQTTERISVSGAGVEGNLSSDHPSINADGRFVTFRSDADNLATGDTNNLPDIFLRDRVVGRTLRMSLAGGAVPADGASGDGRVSTDGRFVAFSSDATNLVSSDTNHSPDIFLRSLLGVYTTRESVDSSERQVNRPLPLSQGSPSVNADGDFIAFESNSDQLVPGDAWVGSDIFVRNRQFGTTELASVDSGEAQKDADSYQPSISSDGRFVAFVSLGAFVADDTNNKADVYVRDRLAGTTERVSLDSNESQANGSSEKPSITGDGRFVIFVSQASNLVTGDTNGVTDVFLRDRLTGITERVSVGNTGSQGNRASENASAVSGDGRYIAFQSSATNLVFGDTNGASDIFVRDRRLETTHRVSVTTDGRQANNSSSEPALSYNGRFLTFQSSATNLVPDDTNGSEDIFLHDRGLLLDGCNDLLVDFGNRGLYQRMNDRSWLKINGGSPIFVTVGDLDGNLQDEVIAKFASGLWARFNNAGPWQKLHGQVIAPAIAFDGDGDGTDELIATLHGRLYLRKSDGRWNIFRSEPTDDLAVGDLDGDGREELIIDSGYQGLWVRRDLGKFGISWMKLDASDALLIATGDLDGNGKDELIADFGGSRGLQARFNNAGTWVKLHSWSAEALVTGDLDGNDQEELIVDFGSRGLYARYNNVAPWVRLHKQNPISILAIDLDGNSKSEVVASFPGIGLHVRRNNAGAWVRLHSWVEQGMAVGGFD